MGANKLMIMDLVLFTVLVVVIGLAWGTAILMDGHPLAVVVAIGLTLMGVRAFWTITRRG